MESLPEGWNICRECLGAVLNDITLYITISRFISPRQATGVSRRLPRSCTEVTGYKQTKFSSCYWFYQLTNLNINIISLHTFHSLHTGSANCPQPRTIKVFRNLLSLGKGEGMGGGEVQKLSAACKFFRISCLVIKHFASPSLCFPCLCKLPYHFLKFSLRQHCPKPQAAQTRCKWSSFKNRKGWKYM